MILLPNRHSRPETLWKPVSPELAKDLIPIARQFWDGNWVVVEELQKRVLFSLNYRLWDKGEQWLYLKTVPVHNRVFVELRCDLAEWCARCGVPTPSPIRTRSGEWCHESGKLCLTAFPFIHGPHFRGTQEEFVAAIEVLRKLHDALNSYPERETVVRSGLLGTHKSLAQTVNAFIIHGDFHPHNLLFPMDSMCMVIDLARVGQGSVERDLADALHRLGRQVLIHEGVQDEAVIQGRIRTLQVLLKEIYGWEGQIYCRAWIEHKAKRKLGLLEGDNVSTLWSQEEAHWQREYLREAVYFPND